MAVLNGFLNLGLDAWLLVGNKQSHHPRVVSLHSSPFFDYRPYMAAHQSGAIELRRGLHHALGIEDFNHPYSRRIEQMTGSPPDLVLCHNLHGGYFDLTALISLSHRLPVALRLFDTWLQTGHCAYSLGCERWRTGCGQCPDLTIPPALARDATGFNLRRKRRMFEKSRLFVSAETCWMLDRARQSALEPAVVEWKHIRGGVDLEVFFAGSREDARRELGLELDPDTRLLLYVAHQGSANRHKDFGTVQMALELLNRRHPGRRILLLVVGSDAADRQVGSNILIRHAGAVASPARLAAFYRAADLLIHSAIEETFGNVVAEALACGTPVLVASGGGVVELIVHGHTGMVVPPRRPALLAEVIARLLDAPELCARMGAAAALSAQRHLDIRSTVRDLHAWCSAIHAAWHGQPAVVEAAP